MRRRVLILDPGLETEAGHHFSLTSSLAEEFARRGADVYVLCHKSACITIRHAVAVLPIFSFSPYDDPTPVATSDLGDAVTREKQTLEELMVLSALVDDPRTILLLHSFRATHLRSLARWVSGRASPEIAPPLLILQCIEFLRESCDGSEIEKQLIGEAISTLRERQYPFGVWVPTPAQAEQIDRSFGLRAACCPIPFLPPERVAFEDLEGQRGYLQLAILGTARSEKGFQLVPEIVDALISKCGDLRIYIQCCTGSETLEQELYRLKQLSSATTRCRLIPRVLQHTEYLQILSTSDGIILPYDPERYRIRSSGIFCEAAAAGVPVVIPARTWMEETLIGFSLGGLSFLSYDAPSVVSASLALISEIETHRQKATAAAGAWRVAHSVENTVSTMLKRWP